MFALYGSVVQLVRTLACHARGRGFESHPNRQVGFFIKKTDFADVAQAVAHILGKDEVTGSSPVISSKTKNPQTNSSEGFSFCSLLSKNSIFLQNDRIFTIMSFPSLLSSPLSFFYNYAILLITKYKRVFCKVAYISRCLQIICKVIHKSVVRDIF